MTPRQEHDTMGAVTVPGHAYYGAQTQRARENFSVSGLALPRVFVRSLALIKQCAAAVNRSLGLLPAQQADAVEQAAREIRQGQMADQFVVDVFQTGSGTSTNMNMNEVVAGRANEILTGKRGGKSPVHPNDQVNKGQSSNDVIPSALHIAAVTGIREQLLPALRGLAESLHSKAHELRDVLKPGRTHLQDALPVTLGQEFGAYARQIELGIERITACEPSLLRLAVGGTAVGTGVNAHPDFAPGVIALIARETGCAFCETENHFEAQAAQDAAVETSGILKTVAVSLSKIANDIRWLSSGPRCGIGEITLPALQPGSSSMPGKVNPVIPEVVVQVAAQVVGNDTVITLGGQGGAFELNTMLPVIAYNLLQSIDIMATASQLFADRCVSGITADPTRCRDAAHRSLSLATYLVPVMGNDRAAQVARDAHAAGKTILEIVQEQGLLSAEETDNLFKKP